MSKKHCVIIDYGMGNLHSAHGALVAVGAEHHHIEISSEPQTIANADCLVLPGVGAMGDCMAQMQQAQIDKHIKQAIQEKPVLGICVGMQALLECSEESRGVTGMGLFKGQVRHFQTEFAKQPDLPALKVPHMGWNQVRQTAHPLWHGIEDNSRFYFVHSYYAQLECATQIKGQTHYGIDFVSAIGQKNLFATQFHPEKSHAAGLRLLQNFLTWNGAE